MLVHTLIVQIIPLLALIGIGFFCGKRLGVNLHSMAIMTIYIFAPFVNFGAMSRMNFAPEYISLPFISFAMSFAITTVSYLVAGRLWQDQTRNLIGMASVSGNTGYFGMPIIIALLGNDWVGVYLMLNLGALFAETTLGYYLAARGNFTARDSMMKVLKLPVFYGIFAGLAVNLAGIKLPEVVYTYWTYAAGAWFLSGMMLIGVALSKMVKLSISADKIAYLFGVKFIVWPLVIVGLIVLDITVMHLFSPVVYLMLAIYGTVPLAGNPVAYAAQLGLNAEGIATAVLLSAFFALFYMPLALFLFQYAGLFPDLALDF